MQGRNSRKSRQEIKAQCFAWIIFEFQKLQKAKEQAAQTGPFFNKIYSTIASIVATSNGINHPYLQKRTGSKNAYIVITSNRGLAGGYNRNICKQVITNEESDADDLIISIGKRGRDILKKKGFSIINEY